MKYRVHRSLKYNSVFLVILGHDHKILSSVGHGDKTLGSVGCYHRFLVSVGHDHKKSGFNGE